MAEAIVIRNIALPNLGIRTPAIIVKLEAALREGIILLKRDMSKERASQIRDAVLDFAGANYGAYMPKKPDKKDKEKLNVRVAKNHKQAADAVVDSYKGRVNEDKLLSIRAAALKEFKEKGTEGLYDEETNVVVINLQNIKAKYREKEFREACFCLTVIHETLHYLGSFGKTYKDHSLEWLDDGVTEILTRSIARNLYQNVVQDRWDPAYDDFRTAAAFIGDIVGEMALLRAFFSRSINPVIEEMRRIGFEEREIDKLFELGEGMLDPDRSQRVQSFKKFVKHAKHLIEKKRRLQREGKLKQLPFDEYGEVYGKAGAAAIDSLKKWNALPAAERTAAFADMRAWLAGQNLIPDGSTMGEVASIDDLQNHLLAHYNQPSIFDADLAINTASAHLAIQNGREPTPTEIAELLEARASSFADYYLVKPALRQLTAAVAEDAYYSYSHEMRISDFMDVGDQDTIATASRLADELVKKIPEGDTGDQAVVKGLSKLVGINADGKIEEVQAMFFFASLVPTLCNKQGDGDRDTIETILLAKARLGDVNRTYTPEEVLAVLNTILRANGFNPEFIQPLTEMPRPVVSTYLQERYGRTATAEDIAAFNKLLRNLNLAYPASIFNFDAKRGFIRYKIEPTPTGSVVLPKPPGTNGSSGSMGKFNPYGAEAGARFGEILSKHGLSPAINPLASGPKVEAHRRVIDWHQPEFSRFAAMFDRYSTNGNEGLKFDMDSERPDGCLTPEEVLERGYALCLEHAFLFLALNKDVGNKVIVFKVFREEEGELIPHICNGVFIDEDYINAKLFEFRAHAHKKPRITYYRFDEDAEFRAELLRKLGWEQGVKRKLVLLDLSHRNFGAQYQEVRPITTDEEILSAYFVDKGAYYMRKDRKPEALESFETALKVNPKDELARSHLVAYYSDIEYRPRNVVELTDNFALLVNTEDLVSRALVAISAGRYDHAVSALMHAIQMSEHAVKARALLREITQW